MLASRMVQMSLARMVAKRGFHVSSSLSSGHGPGGDIFWGFEQANGREVVGFGINGTPAYFERYDHPYPSIRFKKDDAEILALRQKEKGDWNKLTLEEKKKCTKVYRASFCMTFAEFDAPTGHWKIIAGGVLVGISVALWISYGIHKYVYHPLPPTFSTEYKEAMLQRIIDLHQEPITGYASKWDYEKGRWKA